MTEGRLPRAEAAVVPPAKVRDYLLEASHSGNAGKAAFFKRFGFQPDQWAELQADLAKHPTANPVVHPTDTNEDTCYRIRCNLRSPGGRNPCIVTIWAVGAGAAPRLITAFPGPPTATA